MSKLTSDELRRMIAALRKQREDAIDVADRDAVSRLDEQIESAIAEMRAAGKSEGKKQNRTLLKVGLFLLAIMAACGMCAMPEGPTPEEQAVADSVDALPEPERLAYLARQDSLENIASRAEAMASPYGRKAAVEVYLESVANDPGSIEVRACSDPEFTDETQTSAIVRCEFTGKNGFGGTVRDTKAFLLLGLAEGVVIAAAHE